MMQCKKRWKEELKKQHSLQDPNLNFKLFILQQLQAGIRPSKIAAQAKVSPSALQYHLNKLKRAGIIRKVGYGTWETTEEVKITSYVEKDKIPTLQLNLKLFQQDSVRGHAFLFTVKVPKDLRNWTNEKREQFLEKHKIDYLRLRISGSGQRIIFRNRKVWLLDKSVVIYDTASYFAEKAIDSKSTAIYNFFSIVKGLERLLHVEFAMNSNYKFKVSRQHYALVKNALAKQYTDEGKKLEIRTGKGLWFVIDNSFNLNEAETVHPQTAMTDNKKVQDWFNGLKEQPITPQFVLKVMNGIQQNQLMFAKNTESHIKAVQELAEAVRAFKLNLKLLECKKYQR